MESTLSLQLSPITGSDQNYLHSSLLELWRERNGEEGGIEFTPSDLRKHPLNGRMTRCNKLEIFIDKDVSAVNFGALPCTGLCLCIQWSE